MKIKYKHQKFQVDAAKAVVDVFAGQPYLTPTYMIDMGRGQLQQSILDDVNFTGWSNQKIIPSLNDQRILENINKIQRTYQIEPSKQLEGRYNLTVEMETGVGKTYTYIKTMYELNKAYGWTKFIVVVPSIAIREGVYKSFEMTQEHFKEEYGKAIKFFIYNSSQLNNIDQFASDNFINVMIINSQAFNANGKDARRIYMELDEFRSRRPIDVIAKTNPILIIDEPQSVEGAATREKLKEFNPLFTLRYSATHKKESIYNMVYRLDAVEAYNKRLVKKIAVKGISEIGTTATNSFVYLDNINLSSKDPTATIIFECKGKNGIKKKTKKVNVGDNLFDLSGELEEYKDNFVVKQIDKRDDSIEFLNSIKLYVGQAIGEVDEEKLRRIQIRETITSHIQRERELFYKGIKVLSLFFIDEVANYRVYDVTGQQANGKYAEIFEEEYKDVVGNLQIDMEEDDYIKYLNSIDAEKTHAGYFSIDKGKMVNSKVGKKETTSNDVSAYELIMKNKELLLDRDPKRSPVRFIFSHSALREGWDNPNVFQICTLKQSNADVRKRQEVGRGLRLCVNQEGERMDANVLGSDVHNVNVLTIIASESYDDFAKGLQSEIAEAVADRPRKVDRDLFIGKVIRDEQGNEQVIDQNIADKIVFNLTVNQYINSDYALTDKYYEDRDNNSLVVAPEVADSVASIVDILDTIYKPIEIDNPKANNIECTLDENKLNSKEFKALWEKINSKSVYVVNFESKELVKNSIESLNKNLNISPIYFRVESGEIENISSKQELKEGEAFLLKETGTYNLEQAVSSNVKYDLVGELVNETNLTRKDIVAILKGINKPTFDMFKNNPEEFIIRASAIINDEKATAIIEHITYNVLDEEYDTNIFADATIKGRLDKNAMKANKHLYDHIVYDSEREKEFAEKLDTDREVAVYVKLPNGFYISTPVGRYNPDWAIAFYEDKIKHIYFVAETKGTLDTLNFTHISPAEQAKIDCARKHFAAISTGDVVYDVVKDYETLMEKVMR